MPNFKKDRKGFQLPGFSPFNMGNTYKTPMKKPLVGDQDKLPENLKQEILDSPMKKYSKKSAMKKHGKSAYKKKSTPTVSSKKKHDKSMIQSWKDQFAKLDDPMESNRGKALAEKLMAGVDPSTIN